MSWNHFHRASSASLAESLCPLLLKSGCVYMLSIFSGGHSLVKQTSLENTSPHPLYFFHLVLAANPWHFFRSQTSKELTQQWHKVVVGVSANLADTSPLKVRWMPTPSQRISRVVVEQDAWFWLIISFLQLNYWVQEYLESAWPVSVLPQLS